MVQSPHSGAHPSPDAGPAAPRNRTGHRAQFQRFLFRWQHVVRGSRLHGVDGTLQIIQPVAGLRNLGRGLGAGGAGAPRRTLRAGVSRSALPLRRSDVGAPVAASGVRRSRAAPRATDAHRADRASSCARAPIGWQSRVRSGPTLSARRRATFWRNSNSAERHSSPTWSAAPAAWRAKWKTDSGNWSPPDLVTADGFENLRALVDPKRRRGEGRGRHARPRHAAGRWALVRHAAGTLTSDARAAAFADQLLARWGVIFRDLLARETLAPPWRDLAARPAPQRSARRNPRRPLRLRLQRRTIRASRSARPAARRPPRRTPTHRRRRILEVSNADPLNLAGIILPGPRVSTLRIAHAYMCYRNPQRSGV